ncbi:MAG: hypothetical protein QM487_11260 [Candidatus Marithrix sp.]
MTVQQYSINDPIFHPNTGIIRIPVLQIVGDKNLYAVEIQSLNDSLFEVISIMPYEEYIYPRRFYSASN